MQVPVGLAAHPELEQEPEEGAAQRVREQGSQGHDDFGAVSAHLRAARDCCNAQVLHECRDCGQAIKQALGRWNDGARGERC
jgi:hypothetical protein